jgi:hypothetical protein
VSTTEHAFSDLLRSPNQVVHDLERGDVVLRRRDAPDLRLTLAGRDEDRSVAFAMVGRTLRNLAAHSPDALGDAISSEFPWTSLLPPADLDEFLAEFTRAVMAASEVDTFTVIGQLLHEWRATAAVHGDSDLAGRLSSEVRTEGSPVPQPT